MDEQDRIQQLYKDELRLPQYTEMMILQDQVEGMVDEVSDVLHIDTDFAKELRDEYKTIFKDIFVSFGFGELLPNESRVAYFTFIEGIQAEDLEDAFNKYKEYLKTCKKILISKVDDVLVKKKEALKNEKIIELYGNTIKFAIDALKKEINELEEKITKIEEGINKLLANGLTVSSDVKAKLKKLKTVLARTKHDCDNLEMLLNEYKIDVQLFIDPSIKKDRLLELNNQKVDINCVSIDSSKQYNINNIKYEMQRTVDLLDQMIEETDYYEEKNRLEKEKKERIAKYQERLNNIESYSGLTDDRRREKTDKIDDEIAKLNSRPELNTDDIYKNMVAKVKPLFETKDLDQDGPEFNHFGKSMFYEILYNTRVYESLGERIDYLEKSLQNVKIKKELADEKEEKRLIKEEKSINNEIEKAKHEQTVLIKSNNILMLKRQQAINIRNNRIAHYEKKVFEYNRKSLDERRKIDTSGIRKITKFPSNSYYFLDSILADLSSKSATTTLKRLNGEEVGFFATKASKHLDRGNDKRAWIYGALAKLKSKPIFIHNATVMLETMELVTEIKQRKISKHGMINGRDWQDYAIEELEKSSGKSL